MKSILTVRYKYTYNIFQPILIASSEANKKWNQINQEIVENQTI